MKDIMTSALSKTSPGIRSLRIRPETKGKIKSQVDDTLQFMASGGAATGIIAAISAVNAVPMSLGVGVTLGLGLAPVMWLGTHGLRAGILKIFQLCAPQKYNRFEEYGRRYKDLFVQKKKYRAESNEYLRCTKCQEALKQEYRDVARIEVFINAVSAFITMIAAFFVVNAVVGTVHVLPFIGIIVLTVVLLLVIPKPSRMFTYVKTIIKPNEEDIGQTLEDDFGYREIG